MRYQLSGLFPEQQDGRVVLHQDKRQGYFCQGTPSLRRKHLSSLENAQSAYDPDVHTNTNHWPFLLLFYSPWSKSWLALLAPTIPEGDPSVLAPKVCQCNAMLL